MHESSTRDMDIYLKDHIAAHCEYLSSGHVFAEAGIILERYTVHDLVANQLNKLVTVYIHGCFCCQYQCLGVNISKKLSPLGLAPFLQAVAATKAATKA